MSCGYTVIKLKIKVVDILSILANKPKMAYSRDLPKMAR